MMSFRALHCKCEKKKNVGGGGMLYNDECVCLKQQLDNIGVSHAKLAQFHGENKSSFQYTPTPYTIAHTMCT